MKARHNVFRREATRRNERGAGGDDQGAVRACKRGAESLDGAPVDRADGLESRKVMDEAAVNYAIRSGGSTAAGCRDPQDRRDATSAPAAASDLGALIRASETKHLMARVDELLHNGGPDKTCSAGDEDTHRDFSLNFVSWPRSRPRRHRDRRLRTYDLCCSVRIIFAIVRNGPWTRSQMCSRCSSRAVIGPEASMRAEISPSGSRSTTASNATPWFPASAGSPWRAFPIRCVSGQATASCCRAGGLSASPAI